MGWAMSIRLVSFFSLLGSLGLLIGCGPKADVQLLNVGNDPTRELWRDVNEAFLARHHAQPGAPTLEIKQSHAASGSQARSVIDGLDADVTSLAIWPDTDALRKKGLIQEGWEDRLPNRSVAYQSTIVFVVRKGNPKGIKEWSDLVKPGVAVIVPNPKTSGNGRLAFLAAWGSVVLNGGTEAEAREFVTKLYRLVPVLDAGARGSTTTFSQKLIGDVHLTFENEAHLEVREAGEDKLEIVFPSQSILAEPHVALVDTVVDRKGTREIAEEYLKFLYTTEGQEIIARHYYRPVDKEVFARHKDRFPEIKLFRVTELVSSWDEAQGKFFGDGGVFDVIYQPAKTRARE